MKNLKYRYKYNNNDGEMKYLYADSLASLREKEILVTEGLREGLDIANSRRTLNSQYQRYRSSKHFANATLKNYDYMWDKFVKDSKLGKMSICDIKKADVLGFYKSMKERNLSNGTIQIFHKMIHPSLELAVDEDCIKKNPARKCTRDYPEKAKEKVPLTLDQQERFLEYVKNNRTFGKYYVRFYVMLKTSARSGEISGLTWSDIDFENRTISLNIQLLYRKIEDKATFYISENKSESRVLYMQDEMLKLLKDYKENPPFKIDKNFEVDGVTDFVFRNTVGKGVYLNSTNGTFNKIVRDYNLEETKRAELSNRMPKLLPHISNHIMRHTGCTRYAESGMDIKVLQYIMGHKKIEMTMNVYNHISENRVKQEMERV